MPSKTRIIFVSILILLGGALFFYCVFFYPIDIAAPVQGDPSTVTASGAVPVEETSTGGVERDKSGRTAKGRSEGRPRPRSGAT